MTGTGTERRAVLALPEGVFEYKLTLGQWDREALGPSGTVMPNSRISVDGPEVVQITVSDFKKDVALYLADPAGAGTSGQLMHWPNVTSPRLEQPRTVSIWLPPAYAAEPNRRFPVLYMQDGQNLFDPRIANTGVDWGVDEALQALSAAGAVEPHIVVGVWSTDLRRREYAPARVLGAVGAEARPQLQRAVQQAPLADAYVAFLVQELKPRIDQTFRTRPEAGSTAIMGSSMGGLISFYALTEYPDVFGAAAGLSMHWPISVERTVIVDEAETWRPVVLAAYARYLAGQRIDPTTHRLWFDHGTENLDGLYAPYQDAMAEVLAAKGFRPGPQLALRTYPGTDHNEAAWRARLQEPLRFLLAPAATTPAP